MHESDPASYARGEPGLSADAVEWIAQCDVAAVGMDNWGIEPVPAPAGTRPLHCHERLLCDLGIYLFEGLKPRPGGRRCAGWAVRRHAVANQARPGQPSKPCPDQLAGLVS